MAPHQERVVAEKAELDDKITKLSDFSNGTVFATLPAAEQGRLKSQFAVMREYSGILGERIAAFTV